MARGVGRLSIHLIAQTAGFQAGMKRARKQMRYFQRRAKLVNTLMRKFAAILAVRQIIMWARATAQAIDSLAKFSRQIGMSTENLAGLRHAAQLTGVETRTLDMGLQRMTRRIAEAAKGTGEAKTAIKELGLDAKRLAEAGPGAAFSAIADALKGVESQSDKVRLAFKLFDSEGVALVNTLALGSIGLAKYQREARSLGLTVSREAAAKVEEMNDAITRTTASVRGLGRELMVALAPAIQTAADEMTEIMAATRELTREEEKSKDATIERYRTLVRAYEAGFVSRKYFEDAWRDYRAAHPVVIAEPDTQAPLARYELYQNQLTKAAERGKTARGKLVQHQITGVQNWMSALTSLTSINANESKKQFELHKKASIAEALVNTAAGITRAFRELGPFAWPQVAAIGASGIAQIAQIRSTTFQGGGAVAAPAAGAEALGAGAGAEAAAPITVRATLTGTDFSGEGIRNFIDRLNEEHQDGYRLIID